LRSAQVSPPSVLQPAPLSAAGSVESSLRNQILKGVLPGGQRLMQDAIAAQFGVSQSMVREAFKQLAAEGFLRSEPRKGVTVAALTREDADELTHLRSAVEAQALEWAIPKLTKADLEQARLALKALETAASPDDVILWNARFHDALYDACARPRTLALIATLRMSFDRYFRVMLSESGHPSRSQQEHRDLLRLCRSGDVPRACALLRAHLVGTGKGLALQWKRRELNARST